MIVLDMTSMIWLAISWMVKGNKDVGHTVNRRTRRWWSARQTHGEMTVVIPKEEETAPTSSWKTGTKETRTTWTVFSRNDFSHFLFFVTRLSFFFSRRLFDTKDDRDERDRVFFVAIVFLLSHLEDSSQIICIFNIVCVVNENVGY